MGYLFVRSLRHACQRLLFLGCILASPTALGLPGDLDTSGFGSGVGKVFTQVGSGPDRISAIAQQADGRIVVAGGCDVSGVARVCLARFDAEHAALLETIAPPDFTITHRLDAHFYVQSF